MRKLWILLLASFYTVILSAQSTSILSLEDCIKRAEQNSFRLQSDDYEISAAENTASLAQLLALPRIDGELASESRFLKPYYFSQLWAGVHADWSLGDFIKKTGRSAEQDIVTRRILKEQSKLDVIGQSTSLFISILQVRKQIEIIVQRLGLMQQHYELSQSMWKAGVRSQLDVLQTETEIVSLREDTARLAIVRKNLRNELSHILGWDNTDSLHLMQIELEPIVVKPIPSASLLSLSSNPILASFDSKMKAQNLRTEEIVADQYPHLRMGSGIFADGDPSGDGHYFQINAGLVVPIFYNHEPKYRKQRSEAIVGSLNSQKMEVERKLMINILKTHDRLLKLKELLNLQNSRQYIALKAVSIAEMNYKAGISSNLEYISAQQRVTDTQLAIEETHLEYIMNMIEYYISTNQIDQIIAMGNKE